MAIQTRVTINIWQYKPMKRLQKSSNTVHAGINMQHHENEKLHISFQMQKAAENLLFTMLPHLL